MGDRGRANLSKNKDKEEAAKKPLSRAPENPQSCPNVLTQVDESSLSAMVPGDVFLIEQLAAADPDSLQAFHAILSCPLCGSKVLISAAQYFGFTPVICGARDCSGFFRITDDGRFDYLPVN